MITFHLLGATAMFAYMVGNAGDAKLFTPRRIAVLTLGCAAWEAVIFWSLVRAARGKV